ncbi:MAG TPA: biopolymer transporter ExbD [Noviherbaspirillum sp.]|uniref:ExbD/TolR family protein n=1 Tax=Noviherbaspirillum sp. TaxID=1926288 RepID=UPI002B4799A0|nr:biopolymer transporter ExbD [Noviherbaspirillum sp.]HJV87643.1 biopolymer transporter ExbD [Noviherbaspirillum sp.]
MAFNNKQNSGGTAQPMAEINTTPLVDVMLVLLVIFIITAPLFHQAIPVDLPKVDGSRVDDKPRTVQVALDAEGKVFVDGKEVPFDALDERLHAIAGTPMLEMHLRADRATRYDRVAAIMATAQKNGISRIAFVTEGEDHARH